MDYLFLENIQLQNNTVRGPRCHRWGIRSSPFGAVRSRPCFFWHASSHLQLIYHFLTGGESPYGLPPSPVASSPGLAFLTCLFAFTAHLTFLDRWEIPCIRPARGTLHAASCLMLLGNGSMNFSGSMMLSDLDLRTTRYFWLFRLLPTKIGCYHVVTQNDQFSQKRLFQGFLRWNTYMILEIYLGLAEDSWIEPEGIQNIPIW